MSYMDNYHKDPSECPTWHDGCNCTPETCVNLSRLLDEAEARWAELREFIQSMTTSDDKNMEWRDGYVEGAHYVLDAMDRLSIPTKLKKAEGKP